MLRCEKTQHEVDSKCCHTRGVSSRNSGRGKYDKELVPKCLKSQVSLLSYCHRTDCKSSCMAEGVLNYHGVDLLDYLAG